MIEYESKKLDNGLRVLAGYDAKTPMTVVNILYEVGARDEHEDRTGFAHLFEHLMFGGSKHAEKFDRELEVAGGSNNAFTNNDLTNYFDTIPAQNIETALWLESDRMMNLNISERSLNVQRSVVSEEFKENYLNQPYGEASHHLRALAFTRHPYRWPTIGKNLQHIEEATLEDVRNFYDKHYHPGNAILSIAGNVKPPAAFELAEKWFGDIPAHTNGKADRQQEPTQLAIRRKTVEEDVPLDAIYMAFHADKRNSDAYYANNLITDILANGPSSRLYTRLVKKSQLFNSITAYADGALDPGLIIIAGKLSQEVTLQRAEEAIWNEFHQLKTTPVKDQELDKVKNKVESEIAFNLVNLMHRGFALSYYEMLGSAGRLNDEIEQYRSITDANIIAQANKILIPENASVLYYKRKDQ